MEKKLSVNARKGAWTKEEDVLLTKCIQEYGEGRWHLVPLRAGLSRCRKSCRMRWLNYLNPNLKRGRFATDEVDLIVRMHKLLGNRWSLIAGRLPGRTANAVKNFWNSHICKKQSSTTSTLQPTSTLTKIIKPRPRMFTMSDKFHFLDFPTRENNSKDKHASSSSSSGVMLQDQDKDESTDEWWRNLLENVENGEGASFLSLQHHSSEEEQMMNDLFFGS